MRLRSVSCMLTSWRANPYLSPSQILKQRIRLQFACIVHNWLPETFFSHTFSIASRFEMASNAHIIPPYVPHNSSSCSSEMFWFEQTLGQTIQNTARSALCCMTLITVTSQISDDYDCSGNRRLDPSFLLSLVFILRKAQWFWRSKQHIRCKKYKENGK